jgi:predicted P-type ATPase
LGVIAFAAFIDQMVNAMNAGLLLFEAIIESLVIITIVVPPALPLILTVGIGFSLARLKKMGIFCINPERLNYAGRIDTMCFDKTGTLTDSKQKFIGTDLMSEFKKILDFSPRNILGNRFSIERFMTVCHEITKSDGELIGHGLDTETFSRTGLDVSAHKTGFVTFNNQEVPIFCVVDNNITDPLYIIKRFEFDSYLQTSSTISFAEADECFLVCTKGSPEAIQKICHPESIPSNYTKICKKYSMEGYYVIACAAKNMHKIETLVDNITRLETESNLIYIGLLLFENPLKEETFGTIDMLREANIRSLIITGDNAYTAICIAKQLELFDSALLIDYINDKLTYYTYVNSDIYEPNLKKDLSMILYENPEIEICITGAALVSLINTNDLDTIERIMPFIRIFARTKPDQKTWVVEWLIKHGHTVGMCGDGTNDCGALKAAHVGIALSSAEASIVAPFTSVKKSVGDVVELIKEGRCSLETSFVGFKYMMLYPLIQLMISATLNKFGAVLSNNEFLFDDLFVVTGLALFSLYTTPTPILSTSRPTDSLLSPEILYSIIGQISLCVVFFTINAMVAVRQSWYCSISQAIQYLDGYFNPIDPSRGAANYPCYNITELDVSGSSLIKSYENVFLWKFGHIQFGIVIFCISSSVSKFRNFFYTNYYFTAYWLIIMAIMIYGLVFLRNGDINDGIFDRFLGFFFNIGLDLPFEFKSFEALLSGVHLLIGSAFEYYLLSN